MCLERSFCISLSVLAVRPSVTVYKPRSSLKCSLKNDSVWDYKNFYKYTYCYLQVKEYFHGDRQKYLNLHLTKHHAKNIPSGSLSGLLSILPLSKLHRWLYRYQRHCVPVFVKWFQSPKSRTGNLTF
jgi:hypothetical protein